MPGFRNHAQLAARNMLPHQFGLVHAGKDVFVPGHNETRRVGTLMVFKVSTESGRSAMPRCTCATSSGDIFRIMRRAPSTRSGRISRVVLASRRGIMLSKNGSVPRSRTSFAAARRPARASAESAGAFVLEKNKCRDLARDAGARTRTAHIRHSKLQSAERGRYRHHPSRARDRRRASPLWPGLPQRRSLRGREDLAESRGTAWPETAPRGARIHDSPEKDGSRTTGRTFADDAIGNLRVAALYLRESRSVLHLDLDLRIGRGLGPHRRGEQKRLFRHHDPGDGIADQSNSGHKRRD